MLDTTSTNEINLVSFTHLKKREKQSCGTQPHGCFSLFPKLYKWYRMAQCITNVKEYQIKRELP